MNAESGKALFEAMAGRTERSVEDVLKGLGDLTPTRLDGLAQAKAPAVVLQKENHCHRVMMYLAAQGFTRSEIAGITGYTPEHITTVMRQDWFQKQLCSLMEESGKGLVEEMLKGEQFNSLQTLIDIRDDTQAPKAVRAQCAFNILDRIQGKPTQRVETSLTVNPSKAATTVEEVEKQLEDIRRKQKSALGNA